MYNNVMNQIGILLVGDNKDELLFVKSCLDDDLTITMSDADNFSVSKVDPKEISIIVLLGDKEGSWTNGIASQMKSHYGEFPLQLLISAERTEDVESAIEFGADDFLRRPIQEMEIQYRVKAAQIRLRSQKKLHEEREFFRTAVKNEEELSSKILDQHLDLKQAFESMESVNRELSVSNKELEQIARFDTLSGMLNRMSLLSSIDMEMDRAIRTKTELSGMMIDIDNFKNINDNYGHLYGDAVIAEIGRRMRQTLRKYDHAGRYGGEEFFIVLPNSNIKQAYMIAERFRRDLEKNPIVYDGIEIKATASCGVSQFHYGETRDKWIGRSDENMYEAKKSGKNKVVAK